MRFRRRTFLAAGLALALTLGASVVEARFVLNQLTGFGGRPVAPPQPAVVTQTGSTVLQTASVQLGVYDPTRLTVINASIRTDTAAAAITATLGGVSMTSAVQTSAASGINRTAILYLHTGAGSAFENLTSATLSITAAGAQRGGSIVWSILNPAQAAPSFTNTSTLQNASMNLDKYLDGGAIAGGYNSAVSTSFTWNNIANSLTIEIAAGPSIPGGWETTNTTGTTSISVTPGNAGSGNQWGYVCASWRGASNPP